MTGAGVPATTVTAPRLEVPCWCQSAETAGRVPHSATWQSDMRHNRAAGGVDCLEGGAGTSSSGRGDPESSPDSRRRGNRSAWGSPSVPRATVPSPHLGLATAGPRVPRRLSYPIRIGVDALTPRTSPLPCPSRAGAAPDHPGAGDPPIAVGRRKRQTLRLARRPRRRHVLNRATGPRRRLHRQRHRRPAPTTEPW